MVVGRACVALSSISLIVAGAVDLTRRGECTGLECGVGADALVQMRLGVEHQVEAEAEAAAYPSNIGKNCWKDCGEKGGSGCNFCGDGACCRKDGHGSGQAECQGAIGYTEGDKHQCTHTPKQAKLPLNIGQICWDECSHKGGTCAYCGAGACCRQDGISSTEAECQGAKGYSTSSQHQCAWKEKKCGANQKVVDYTCVACEAGTWSKAGANAFGENTKCAAITPTPTSAPTSAPTKASYNMEDCDAESKRTGKFGTVVGAIDKIICSLKNQHKADQALIDQEVGRFAECAKLPDTDKEANDKAAKALEKIPPLKKTKENKSEGDVPYDFGDTKDESKAGAVLTKGKVDAKHVSFDTATDALQKAKDAYAAAKKAAEEAKQQKIKEKKQCVCAKKSAYDDVLESAQTKWTKRRSDMKLLRTVKCTIKAGNATALVKCPDQVEEDLSPLDAKASDVKECELK